MVISTIVIFRVIEVQLWLSRMRADFVQARSLADPSVWPGHTEHGLCHRWSEEDLRRLRGTTPALGASLPVVQRVPQGRILQQRLPEHGVANPPVEVLWGESAAPILQQQPADPHLHPGSGR